MGIENYTTGDGPRIYVACLASYNRGELHGAWIDTGDAETMMTDTGRMLRASPQPGAEEWAIHDYEGFAGARVSEHASFETVEALAEFILERGEVGAALLDYYGGELRDARARYEEYRGQFESLGDYARGLMEECGPALPDAFRHYIDWDGMGRDMEINGEIVAVETGHACIHVFGGA